MPSQACFASYVSAMPASVHMGLKFVSVSGTRAIADMLVNLTSSKIINCGSQETCGFFPIVVEQPFEAFAFFHTMTHNKNVARASHIELSYIAWSIHRSCALRSLDLSSHYSSHQDSSNDKANMKKAEL